MRIYPYKPVQPNGIILVGEAPGAEEERQLRPFVGRSGKLLERACSAAGVKFGCCYRTNVFMERPPRNDLEAFLIPTVSFKEYAKALPGYAEKHARLGPVRRGKYVHPRHWSDVERLWEEIREQEPKVIIALGATACWALTGENRISTARGFFFDTEHGLVLPTFHPAAVLRNEALYPTLVMDIAKAKERPEPIEPEVWIIEDVEDVAAIPVGATVAVDIETTPSADTIDLIGYGFGSTALVDTKCRIEVFREVRRRAGRLVFHNGLYDLTWLREQGWPIGELEWEDTMAMAHALEPELPKSLEYLASVFLPLQKWKDIREGGWAEGSVA